MDDLTAIQRPVLVAAFARAIRTGEAAVFVGAGLSKPAGYPDWGKLLTECRRTLGLEDDRNLRVDHVAIAQYFVNNHAGNRVPLSDLILQTLDLPEPKPTRAHEILSRLQVSEVWTTNYDSLLEDALRANGRRVEVRENESQFMQASPSGRDVVVYKMHGSLRDGKFDSVDNLVIAKEDYERYQWTHRGFADTLTTRLREKTFLFLGYSFSDPNVDYILGHLGPVLEREARARRVHYTIMRRENSRLQLHRCRDLMRYGIQTCLVDEYDAIPDILGDIESRHNRRNVFLSLPARDTRSADSPHILCRDLGYDLARRGFVVSVGGESAYAQHVSVRAEEGRKGSTRYVPDLRSSSLRPGIAIFIGNGRTSATAELERDFENCLPDIVPIPVPATGRTARALWTKVKKSGAWNGLGVPAERFDRLEHATDPESQVRAIIAIVEALAD
jgi:hypothetical protein